MKNHTKALPLIAAVWGGCAALSMLGLHAFGTDHKGLLLSLHPLAIILWVLTLGFAAFAALSVRTLPPANDVNFAPSAAAAIGCFALAGGITVASVSGSLLFPRMDLIRNICGLLTVPALILLGLNRFSGKRPFFLVPGLVCLYLTLHTISHYPLWSSRPQPMIWFFPMAASVALCLFSYQQTASAISMGKRRTLILTGLLAGFFCVIACVREDGMLYLGAAVWALTNLGSLKDPCHDAA